MTRRVQGFLSTDQFSITCLIACAVSWSVTPVSSAEWPMHIIDGTSQGADGVRLADFNGDGFMDTATGWEEGGQIRICLNPGPSSRVREPWPSVEVGRVRAPEDAFWCDLDGDGVMEVVSCCEGRTRSVYIHSLTNGDSDPLNASNWRTVPLKAAEGIQLWMYGIAGQFDDRPGPEMILGSKGQGAGISMAFSPTIPAVSPSAWQLKRLSDAGWIMSLRLVDMDGDGDADVLLSDRNGPLRGVRWLENPGGDAAANPSPWANHFIGGRDHEVMFLDYSDLDKDGYMDIGVATREGEALLFFGVNRGRGLPPLRTRAVPNPQSIPHGKALRFGDIDLDGVIDLIHTTNTGTPAQAAGRPGTHWLAGPFDNPDNFDKPHWNPVGSDKGRKFDRIELLDLDGDGDLDCLTCEEQDNLGLIWYENPTR